MYIDEFILHKTDCAAMPRMVGGQADDGEKLNGSNSILSTERIRSYYLM